MENGKRTLLTWLGTNHYSNMLTEVTLHGGLADYIGKKTWRLAVKSPRQAINAIEANSKVRGKSIYRYLMEKDDGLAEYRIIIDGVDYECLDELIQPMKHYKTIDIVPVPRGSGNSGLFAIIIGVILVIVGIVLLQPEIVAPGASVLGTALTVGALATALILQGISLVLSGLVQLLVSPSSSSAGQTKPSYLFGGIVNSVDQGVPLQIGYGKQIVGSAVLGSIIQTVPYGSVVSASGELQTNDPSHPSIDDNPSVGQLGDNVDNPASPHDPNWTGNDSGRLPEGHNNL